MQKWLDLLTPSAAAVAILLVIALLIQTIRHGRAVKRLESRLAEREGAGARVSLDRLRQLQARGETADTAAAAPVETPARDTGRRIPLGSIAAITAVVAVVAGTTWYLFLRGDDTSAETPTRTASTATSTRPTPIDKVRTTVAADPKALPQTKGAYTILVLNGTTISGAAGQGVVPVVQNFGYNTAPPDNAATRDFKVSAVVALPGKEDVADNVGKDLGITRLMTPDGVGLTQETADVDAIVIVGEDLATKYRP